MHSDQELTKDYFEGTRLSSADARELRERIRRDPENLLLQMRLFAYFSRNSGSEAPPSDTLARVNNFIWLITKIPQSIFLRYPDPQISTYGLDHPYASIKAYARVSKCWMDALASHRDDPNIAINTAAFFRFHRPQTSVEILLGALTATSVSVDYLKHLCWSYQFLSRRNSQIAMEGLGRIQAVLDGGSVQDNWVELSVSLAELAVDCGDLDAARKHLENFSQHEGEKDVYDINSLIHKAHVLRGQVVLKDGDSQMAAKELLLAADVPDSPHMKNSGPSMRLARDLLRAGEKSVVLEYLERWKGRWDGPASFLLTKWEDEIQRGEEPDFDPNVRY